MLLLATACQLIVDQMIALLENGTPPDRKTIQHAAALMTEKGRLEERGHGLVWNKTVQWTIRGYKKPLPRASDFRLVLGRVKTKTREAAAKRIIGLFISISKTALWYFEQPPDFDGIITREAVRDLAKIDDTAR
jgi:hypothetical protein